MLQKFQTKIMFNGFDPVIFHDSRVLILGSFPSVKSRAQGFYYGNKQNRFWRTLSQIFEVQIEDDINSKIDFLKRHKIALFDIISQSDLSGSADFALEKSQKQVANLEFLLPPHSKIEKILCNGKTSYKILMEMYSIDLPIICLPSTSSANPRYDFNTWKSELEFLI